MIFQFPDPETFRLAITSALVPPDVSLAPAEIAADAQGRLSVKPAGGIPPKAMQNGLKKLGVAAGKDHVGTPESVSCWLEGLPVTREAAIPELASSAPVLFEMPASQLPVLVGEMLRLGNDRQSFRYLETADEKAERILLRVIGPPYYTLLRALEQSERDPARVIAYVERSPNVWVEIGYNHPLAAQIQPPAKHLLLIRPPHDWTFLEEVPFHDVYEILDFPLLQAPIAWQERDLPDKLTVPLRLVPGNAADAAEMWVIRKDAVDQLDALVRDADERLMARLAFAVAEEPDGSKTIVLRTRPSKLSPPVLQLEGGLGFKPYWKLPNLFLPVGTRLQPMLRRDAVRKLLADDPAQVVWLMPRNEGDFAPESLPDEAFRPLEDWVHYIIDHERQPLTTWVQATQFDFDQFICKDEQPDKPKPPGDRPKRRRPDERGDDEVIEVPIAAGKGKKKTGAATSAEEAYAPPVVIAPPNELKKQLRELENTFHQQEGPLDAPERLVLWPQLARLNSALGDYADASICWTNAVWEQDGISAGWADAWLQSEAKGLKLTRPDATVVLDRVLASPSPTAADVRAAVAAILSSALQQPVPAAFMKRLPEIRKFLESHEKWVGIRAVWLAWLHLARLSGSDVLTLARVRDRLLQRLLDEGGLNRERDLPTFLRLSGVRDSDRLRIVRERVLKLHGLVQKWITFDQDEEKTEVNRAYVDLMFAFGMARLGEATAARNDLLGRAAKVLLAPRNDNGQRQRSGNPNPVHAFLLDAFAYRVEEALAGKPHAGPLSAELIERMEQLGNLHRYMVDRMREQSNILEPQERFDPYRMWKKQEDEVLKEIAALPDVRKPAELQQRIGKLVRNGAKDKQSPELRAHVLGQVLPLAPRVGEEFTGELLQLVPAALEAVASSTHPEAPTYQATLLQRAFFQAAHFDRRELVEMLANRFVTMLRSKSGKSLHELIDRVGGQTLGSLRKVGMKDEIQRLFAQMAEQVLGGQSLEKLRAKHRADWSEAVRALLRLAEGWFYFGTVDAAEPFLNEARLLLLETAGVGKNPSYLEYAKLACTYAAVLGQAPVDMALARIEEMFKKMAALPNTFTTATHYSRLHLNVVEAVVLAIVSEDFALGPTARRWLDDDEYLVRRRIHRDMKSHLVQSGL
jgi:FtsH ternary system domain X7